MRRREVEAAALRAEIEARQPRISREELLARLAAKEKLLFMAVDRDTEKWVRTWQVAGPLLAEIERRELEQMTDEERQQAIEDVLSVVPVD
ncbi:MAG: hypothetical protein B7Z73_17840, partial [Planctomycetia bacterium 21-64-5]